MTKRNFYEVIKVVAQDMQGNDSEYIWGTIEDTPVKNEDVINFCNHEIELLDNRVNKKKPSKQIGRASCRERV